MSKILDPDFYIRYFAWNDALIEYFFNNKQKEILLYIDETILKEIGTGILINCENYKSKFYKCVENFCSDYTSVFLSNRSTYDVLAVAEDMRKTSRPLYKISKNNNNYREDHQNRQRLPYLSIVIYVIMKFDEGETQEWRNVNHTHSNSHQYIENLWKGISEYDDRFDENASVYDRTDAKYGDYVGRILYHLPLSSSIRHKIEDAIYKSSVWKVVDRISFEDLINHISRSLKKIDKNSELNDILLQCYKKGIYARKLESVIENFDIESYEDKILERKQTQHFKNTITSGKFALALYFPNDPDDNESNIVLLTTIQSPLEAKNFLIEKGSSGSLDGYNTMFIRSWDKKPIKLQEYRAKNANHYNIEPIKFDDVLFFYKYQYDDCLYIQTDKLIPASEYIIAVKNAQVEKFTQWCQENKNNVILWPIEDTSELFGTEWRIFFSEERLNGEYYTNETAESNVTDNDANETNSVIMRGGIPCDKSRRTFFINALPYFEVPAQIDINNIKICLNLNGKLCEENKKYKRIISGQRIILDFDGFPFESDDKAYIDVCLAIGNKPISESFSFAICGQRIEYNQEDLYSYDRLGLIDESRKNESYSGNTIKHDGTKKIPHCAFNINVTELNEILTEFYFINLIAACCYSDTNSEITYDQFCKCVNYAANRLNVDTNQEDFISKAKRLMAYSGILSLKYNPNKCQAIPPFFMSTPFSLHATARAQLIMLGGCYTRAFIADLLEYCKNNSLKVYTLERRNTKKIEEQLLPPVVLIDHRFNAADFCDEYSHTCDILNDNDVAMELLNLVPDNKEIKRQFTFTDNASEQFKAELEKPNDDLLPRLRSIRGSYANSNQWYIEAGEKHFAAVPKGLDTWASMYCHRAIKRPMVFVSNRDHFPIYIPDSIWIPSYIQRALYLMNPGLPKKQKAFICDYPSDKYYHDMKTYNLHSNDRCKEFSLKFVGNSEDAQNLVRTISPEKFTAELWTSKVNGKKHSDQYLFIYEKRNEILAFVHKKTVYLSYNGQYYKIIADSLNEALTFLMKENWSFGTGRTSIGINKQGGTDYQKKYDIVQSEITLPTADKFKIENIKVIS